MKLFYNITLFIFFIVIIYSCKSSIKISQPIEHNQYPMDSNMGVQISVDGTYYRKSTFYNKDIESILMEIERREYEYNKKKEQIHKNSRESLTNSVKQHENNNFSEFTENTNITTNTITNANESIILTKTHIIYESNTYGNISYIINDTMVVNEPKIITVIVSTSESDHSKTSIKTIIKSTPDNIQTHIIRISPLMDIKLISEQDDAFGIKCMGEERQFLERDSLTTWNWVVTPKIEGDYKLILSITIIDNDNSKGVDDHVGVVHVNSNLSTLSKVIRSIKNEFSWIKWLLSVIIIPLFIFYYKGRKKKN